MEDFFQVVEEAVAIGTKDLHRLILARELMNRVTDRCRSNPELPELVELFLSRTLVAVPLGAKLLKVTLKAVDLMPARLGEPVQGSSPGESTIALGSTDVLGRTSASAQRDYLHSQPSRSMGDNP